MTQSYISDAQRAARITRHGKIASLATAFTLEDEHPFSLFFVPKVDNETIIIAGCLLYGDEEASNCPFRPKDWSPVLVKTLSASETLLTDYDIYWGA